MDSLDFLTANERVLFRVFTDEMKRLLDRVDQLERHITEFKYCGTWRANREYRRGNFLTHAGSIWHANEDTMETPGKSNAWTLAAKSR